MWYEIIPCIGIIGGLLSAPLVFNYGLTRLVRGKPYARSLRTAPERKLTMRDERISGDRHKLVGLDAIPDKA